MVRLTGRLDMTIVVDWDAKPQKKITVIKLLISERSHHDAKNYVPLLLLFVFALKSFLYLKPKVTSQFLSLNISTPVSI